MTTTGFPLRRHDDKPQKSQRKGMYILPSLFTTANMALGFYAILQVIQGTAADYWHFDNAAKAIGIAVAADGLDGRIARMTHTESDFGRELDSLADVITFGVAPALLAWLWGFRLLPDVSTVDPHSKLVQLGVIVCFLFLMAGASRLARFNIQVNPQPSNPGRPGKKYFVGMPIPAGAGVISSVIHFQRGSPIDNPWIALVWLCLLLFTSFLMVSNWRFWSAKELTTGRRRPFQLVAWIVTIGTLIALYHQYMLIIIAMAYLVSGVVARLAYSWGRERRHSTVASQQ